MGTSPNNHKSKNLLIKGSDLHFCIADVCGVLLLRKQVQHDETHHSHQTDITPISKYRFFTSEKKKLYTQPFN